jgi:hypothetical protein
MCTPSDIPMRWEKLPLTVVDDFSAAAQSLREHGAQLLRGPIQALEEPKRGEEMVYFKAPWGAFMEILWRPEDLPDEDDTPNRLFAPKGCWRDR